MEGHSYMIKNYAPHLYKNYEDSYYMDMNKATPAKRKGLIERPIGASTVKSADPNNLMQEYFTSVRKKREQLNGTA